MRSFWVSFRCCIRMGSAIFGVPHHPLLPSLPTHLTRTQLQGYLAHKKQRPPLGPPKGPRHSPTVGSWEGVFLCVRHPCSALEAAVVGGWLDAVALCESGGLVGGVQGYLAHKKPPPPRPLQ